MSLHNEHTLGESHGQPLCAHRGHCCDTSLPVALNTHVRSVQQPVNAQSLHGLKSVQLVSLHNEHTFGVPVCAHRGFTSSRLNPQQPLNLQNGHTLGAEQPVCAHRGHCDDTSLPMATHNTHVFRVQQPVNAHSRHGLTLQNDILSVLDNP